MTAADILVAVLERPWLAILAVALTALIVAARS
jgi:hypothetical protein